tara:strand:- start:375 stop:935 length:561 start_codon:yes stop_codon:yes gene_type:complete
MNNNTLINNYFIKIIKGIVVIGIIVWCIFSITALANETNYKIRQICEKSNLWGLLITLLLITIILTTHIITYDVLIGKYNVINKKIIFVLVNIIFMLLIWCCIELYNQCSKTYLINLILYKCLSIWFYLILSCFILLIISIIMFFIYIYYEKLKSNVNNNVRENDNVEFNTPWDLALLDNYGYVTV